MSGPLASWVSEHSRASHRGRAVLLQLALRARHDGTPTSDVTRAQLEHRTGMSLTGIRRGLAEIRRLGEVQVVDRGGGRGRPTRYYIPAPPCPAEAECWECRILADTIAKTGPDRPGFESVNAKGNRAREARNRARIDGNRANVAHTHGTGDGTPPQGGTVTHPESSNRLHDGRPLTGAAVQAQVSKEPASIGDVVAGLVAGGQLGEVVQRLDPRALWDPGLAGWHLSDRFGRAWLPSADVPRWVSQQTDQERGAAP